MLVFDYGIGTPCARAVLSHSLNIQSTVTSASPEDCYARPATYKWLVRCWGDHQCMQCIPIYSGAPIILVCIPIHWGTPVYGNAIPHGDASLYIGAHQCMGRHYPMLGVLHTNLEPTLGLRRANGPWLVALAQTSERPMALAL